MSDGMEWIVRFELPNGGPGPETVASDDLAAEFDVILVLLLRDHYCQVSRNRASAFSDAIDSFTGESIAVVAALPDDQERADYLRTRYDLRFPVLSDAADGTDAADATPEGTNATPATGARPAAMTDGTPRFDAFADVEIGVESLPAIGVLDAASSFPRLVYAEGGDTLQDCPEPDEALDVVRDVVG